MIVWVGIGVSILIGSYLIMMQILNNNSKITRFFIKLILSTSIFKNSLVYLIPFLSYLILGIFLKVVSSPEVTLLITSIINLHSAFVSFFMFQRFSLMINKPEILRNNSHFYNKYLVLTTIIFGWAVVINFQKWVYILFIIPIWFFYGYICAELAIRKVMKKYNYDRKKAIFAINNELERVTMKSMFVSNVDKYPFP